MIRLGLVIVFILPGFLFGQDAKEIVSKSEERARGNSSKAEITIQIVRPKWSREMKMKTWSLGTDFAMTYILSPAKDKGTVMLKRDKEVWNWMPSIERSIKLPPSMMMQSWMGTDFTNDDLVKQSSIVTDYTHKIVGDSTIEGRPCYKIELIPKEDAAVVWGKVNQFIDKKDYLQLRSELYDEDGYLVNIMSGSKVREMGGRLMPTYMEMIPVEKPGNKTIFIYNSLEFEVPLEESFFSTQNMRRIR